MTGSLVVGNGRGVLGSRRRQHAGKTRPWKDRVGAVPKIHATRFLAGRRCWARPRASGSPA